MKMHILFICSFVVGFYAIVCESQCTWSVNKDLPYKDPIFYQRRGRGKPRLLVPNSDKGISLERNQVLKVFCPGTGNYLQQLGRDEVEVTCVNGTAISVEGLQNTVADLECVKAATGDVKDTKKHCLGSRGRLLSIGYETPSGWLQLFDVCYDFSRSIALYAHHTVYGTAIGGAFVGNDRPGFKTSGLPSNVSMNSAYRKTTQETQFRTLLGQRQASFYISNNSYLSKGHLAADADFIAHSWQRGTYFYANVVPQWMTINGGNWKKVENSIKEAAKKKNQLFKVWTGTCGTLELNDENNNKVMMHLSKKHSIPVPLYIWKVVCNVAKSCISIVVLNNPVENNGTICNDICRDTNWYKEGYHSVSKGYINCCEVKDLNNTLHELPNIEVNGILNY